MAVDGVELGIIGCGHAALHIYGLAAARLRGRATVTALYDKDPLRAEVFAADLEARDLPRPRVSQSLPEMLADPRVSAVLNLTPAPVHHEINVAVLEAGKHLFTEKPLALTVADAEAQIALARRYDLTLLCAPAVMATPRFRWLKERLDAGWLGRPTLAVGQYANMGAAAWREYEGDPTVFYEAGVGPAIDTGVYILHAIAGLFGPARRVEAFGGIAIPRRNILISGRESRFVEVAAPDHLLIHLDFGDNRFAQVLCSFATPNSKAPALEIHGETGTVSIPQEIWYDTFAPVDIWLRDENPGAAEGWTLEAPPASSKVSHLVQAGLEHFVDVLAGLEAPILTADHAVHVLEIISAAYRSIADGRAIPLTCSDWNPKSNQERVSEGHTGDALHNSPSQAAPS